MQQIAAGKKSRISLTDNGTKILVIFFFSVKKFLEKTDIVVAASTISVHLPNLFLQCIFVMSTVTMITESSLHSRSELSRNRCVVFTTNNIYIKIFQILNQFIITS